MNLCDTKDKQAETTFEKLLYDKGMIEKMLESINDVVIVVNPETRVIERVNKGALERVFGYSPDEIIGKTTEMLHVSRDSFEKFGQKGEAVLKRGEIFETEYVMMRKNGEHFSTFNRVTVLQEEKGWQGGVVSVVRDISAFKQNENRLERKTAELREWIKEIRCLYDISKIFQNTENPMEKNLQQAAERIIEALQYPHAAGVKISLLGKVYQAGEVRVGGNCIASEIEFENEVLGRLEICYQVYPDKTGADVFMPEEAEMVREIADRISRYVSTQFMVTALEKSEKGFASIFYAHPNPLAIMGLEDRRFIRVNERFARWLGFDPSEIIGRTAVELDMIVDPKDHYDISRQLSGQPFVYIPQMRVRLRSGEIRTVMCWENRIELDDRPCVIATLSDITELKNTEQALAESKNRIKEQLNFQQALLGTIPIPIYYMGIDRRYAGCNAAFENFIGMPRQRMIGKTIEEILPQADLEFHDNADRELLENESVQRFEAPMMHADGTLHEVIFHKAPFYKQDGTLGGLVGVVLDITHRKKLEMQLRQVQKLEAIGTLAGGIAHDFNNILSGIIGYSELNLYQTDLSAIRKNTEQVISAGLRARDLVRQILTFARKSETEDVPLQASSIVKEAVKFLRSSTPASIRIIERIDTTAMIMADPTHMHQLIMNLCTNAVQAISDKEGLIEIHLEERRIGDDEAEADPGIRAGDYVMLTVSDTGHGITPGIREKIFDPYFTTRAKEEGTGLGLAVVKGIVDKYGGHITVHSRVGHGTTFTVLLPVARRPATGAGAAPKTELPKGRETVLVVDDEQAIAQLVKQQLEHLGYIVTARASSTEALDLFKSEPSRFDLVITDMSMPDMSGERLATEMLAIRPDIRIILITGFSEQIVEQQVREAGVREILFKPIETETLARSVRNVLDGRK